MLVTWCLVQATRFFRAYAACAGISWYFDKHSPGLERSVRRGMAWRTAVAGVVFFFVGIVMHRSKAAVPAACSRTYMINSL